MSYELKKEGKIHIITGYGKFKCVKHDTMLLTDNGIINIEDFNHDESNVLNMDNSVTKCCSKFDNQVQDVYKLTTEARFSIESTLEHRYLTLNQGSCTLEWKELKELKIGDYVALSRGQQLFGKDYIDQDIAKYLGILIADGSRNNSKNKESLTLQTKDKHLVDFLVLHSMKVTGKECSVCKNSRGLYVVLWWNIKDILLQKYGLDIQHTADTKVIPDTILRSNKETVLSFLTGLFTDFSTTSKQNLEMGFICTNSVLSKQVQLLLLNLGIFSIGREKLVKTQKYPNGKKYYYLCIRGGECINFINIFDIDKINRYVIGHKHYNIKNNTNVDVVPIANYLKDKIRLCKYRSEIYNLLRSCRFLKNGISYEKLNKINRIDYDSVIDNLIKKRYLWQRVSSISYSVECKTYDIEVPDTHSYVANGFITHNSSAAFGTTLRAINQGWMVLIVQFLKGEKSGEIEIFEKYFKNNVDILRYGINKIVLPNNVTTFDKEESQRGWSEMLLKIQEGKNYQFESDLVFNKPYDLLVLDEVLPAIDLKLITQKQLFDLFDNKPKELEVICTGRVCNKIFMDTLTSKCSLHSDIYNKRHYFSCKCPSCGRSWEYHYLYCPNDGSKLEPYTSARYGIEL